jgi:hypothetical protein
MEGGRKRGRTRSPEAATVAASGSKMEEGAAAREQSREWRSCEEETGWGMGEGVERAWITRGVRLGRVIHVRPIRGREPTGNQRRRRVGRKGKELGC